MRRVQAGASEVHAVILQAQPVMERQPRPVECQCQSVSRRLVENLPHDTIPKF